MNIRQKEQAEKERVVARAEELYQGILVHRAAGNEAAEEIVTDNLANLIVPTIQAVHITRNRHFEKRTLLVKCGNYNYKIFYEEFNRPVKIERSEA